MDCKTSSDLIMSYMDDNITDKDWLDLQHHIAVCEDCREEFLLFQETVDAVKELPMVEPSSNFEMKVLDSIDHSLYKKSKQKWLGIKEIIICSIIYVTFLFGINSAEPSLSLKVNSIPKVIQQLSLLGNLLESLLHYVMVVIVYPRKIIFFVLSIFTRANTSTLLVYSLGLFVLTLVLIVIQTTLFKILKD